jgi:uncharacterized protein YbaP (TraB family)
VTANYISGKYIYRFITVIIFFIFTFAPCDTAFAREAARIKTNKHFLWSIETQNNTVYLLGSIHILGKDSYPLPRAIESIYDCCNKVVFETDLESMENPAAQQKMMKLALYGAGEKLSQELSQSTYRLLEKKMSLAGFQVEQFEQFKPWFVAMTIAVSEFMRLGFDPNLGIDKHFYDKARRDRKEMIFLESNDYQINIFAGLNERQQELFLRETLKELEIIEIMVMDMLKAWKTGDTKRLHSILKMSYDEYPGIYDRFFTNRNKMWVKKIETLMKQNDNILIIVGAGHLVGNNSVTTLLKKKGYRVIQK